MCINHQVDIKDVKNNFLAKLFVVLTANYCWSPDFLIPTSQTKILSGSIIVWFFLSGWQQFWCYSGLWRSWIMMDDWCLRAVSGRSLDCVWNVSGLSLECLLIVSGLSLYCVWTVAGLWLACLWTVYGLSLECIWSDIPGVPGHNLWTVSGLLLDFRCTVSGLSLNVSKTEMWAKLKWDQN